MSTDNKTPAKMHLLKIEECFYTAIVEGKKTCEVRKNDRDFQVGDHIVFTPVVLEQGQKNPYGAEVEITHVLPGGQYGIAKDYVVLSIKKSTAIMSWEAISNKYRKEMRFMGGDLDIMRFFAKYYLEYDQRIYELENATLSKAKGAIFWDEVLKACNKARFEVVDPHKTGGLDFLVFFEPYFISQGEIIKDLEKSLFKF